MQALSPQGTVTLSFSRNNKDTDSIGTIRRVPIESVSLKTFYKLSVSIK